MEQKKAIYKPPSAINNNWTISSQRKSLL